MYEKFLYFHSNIFIFLKEMKQSETRLLDLYSAKFHSQNELEYKLSKEVRLDISHPKTIKSLSFSFSITTN